MKAFLLLVLILSVASCGQSKDSSGGSTENTTLVAKVVDVDDSNYDATFLSMVHTPKVEKSIMDLIMPRAFAALFVNMKPDFAPYYTSYDIPYDSTNGDPKYDCQSFVRADGWSYTSPFCNQADLETAHNDLTSTEALQATLDSMTVYPRIAHNDYSGTSVRIDSVSIANLVQDKYYHFTVTRLGGGVFKNQSNIHIELMKLNFSNAAESSATEAFCGVSIVNTEESQRKGDFIIKTSNSLTANDGNYYNPDSVTNSTADEDEVCFFKIYGTFAGVTIPAGNAKLIRIGKILVNDSGNYPAIESVSFNNQNISTSEVSIAYDEFEEKKDNSGSSYKYGTWEISQATSGVTSIEESFWLFTCGGGGSAGKWLTTATWDTNDSATLLNNRYRTNLYDDYYDIDGDGNISSSSDASVSDAKKFYWRVGGCEEMLMMVSVKDSNNNLVQKKVAIVSE